MYYTYAKVYFIHEYVKSMVLQDVKLILQGYIKYKEEFLKLSLCFMLISSLACDLSCCLHVKFVNILQYSNIRRQSCIYKT